MEGATVTALVLISCFAGLIFAAWYAYITIKIPLHGIDGATGALLVNEDNSAEMENGSDGKSPIQKVVEITAAIATGARAFLHREYMYLSVFIVIFSILILLLLGIVHSWSSGLFSMLAFITGAVTSIICGYLGMQIAVIANSRTAVQAQLGIGEAFVTSFRAGCVMGFALVSIGILVLYILMNLFKLYFDFDDFESRKKMFECIAGYGLGGSSVALFARVGGGIYTKAADVGADLTGKLEFDIPEDDPRNPAVIADNVGDNVGDIAGMGADLFGSFAESSCAAMVIAANSWDLSQHWATLVFPILIPGLGILVCILSSFVATNLMVVKNKAEIEPSLKRQLLVSTVLMTPVLALLCIYVLPSSFEVSGKLNVKGWHIFVCAACGLWSGLIIGYTTEYFTSHSYTPVREVADSCRTGAATNIIYGLALGYKSVIIPVFCLAATIYASYSLAGMYGIAMGALGILSTMSIGLTIDAYGPICDNAGGIAEMAGMGANIRESTDALDAAGNTTAAIGKGFAIGSAAMVSLALFGGFVTIAFEKSETKGIDILDAWVFAGLLVGAMLPYWFSAMTMKSVGKAAYAMMQEVREQFTNNKGILAGEVPPDYARCVAISTDASLKEMIPPGMLVMLTPLIVGYLFGVKALAGVLVGTLVSGVQMAISAANTGGAWDNAKKYIEGGYLADDIGKGSQEHKAAVVGDTVGDPLKDTSGPSLNILVKLSAIIALVFAPSFPQTGLIEKLFHV